MVQVSNRNNTEMQRITERYRRPSKQLALKNEYSFQDFVKANDEKPLITTIFRSAEEVILAYFGILQNASHMMGYVGGCGSIGNSLHPYAYAYELYHTNSMANMSLTDFTDSFQGIGYINLLKLTSAYTPPLTPSSINYFMYETEAITGSRADDDVGIKRQGSYFVYQYGLIIAEHEFNAGWKLNSISYIPEDFLCAPEHGWGYTAEYVVRIVYGDWYQLIENIDDIKKEGHMIYLYASGYDKKYRFDFVRLTNGYDVLLHENQWSYGKWMETNLLKVKDQGFKLSILNPNLVFIP